MATSRPVVVKRMPEKLNMRTVKDFLKDVQPLLQHDRPQIVFDLSPVKQLDAAGVKALLHCMSEAMRRDGDLKLASPSPQAGVVLNLTRTDRLFEIYHSSTDATRSFTAFLPNTMIQKHAPEHVPVIDERIAA